MRQDKPCLQGANSRRQKEDAYSSDAPNIVFLSFSEKRLTIQVEL